MFCKKHYTLIALKMIIKQIIDFFKLKYFVLAIKFFTLTVYDTTKYLFAQYATTDRIFIFFIKKWSKWRIKDIFNSSLKSLAMHWQSICRMFFQYSHLLLIRVYCCESLSSVLEVCIINPTSVITSLTLPEKDALIFLFIKWNTEAFFYFSQGSIRVSKARWLH